ncbi:sugar ABC transporter substrate-binding protein [Paenibacillus psychroresistens]|uniref:Sugar ABC transporter substrate-binding protein n=1 Tax=Paenibacillus psychroresistens TaxID=1778678 RepID=A0A6B8RI42_9BACL|nr:sugar ABC transporter substrate-binding protein [Paenibacillus psychroresistens]QGQ96121.1 sugar ABC transporter substrate-binding protein [Paenibacillus psychroresistens]
MRKTLKFFPIVLIILGAIGCDYNTVNTTVKEETTLSYLMEFGYSAYDLTKKKSIEKSIEKFQDENPTITIKLETASYDNYTTELNKRVTDNNPPDIITMWAQDVADYNEQGYLTDLKKFIKLDQLNDEDYFYDKFNDLFVIEGELLAIPNQYNSIGVFYNKKWFDNANIGYPSDEWTWEEFMETAKELKAFNQSEYGVVFPFGLEFIEPLIISLGGSILSPDFSKASGYLNNKQSLKAFKWVYDLIKLQKLSPVESSGNWRTPLQMLTTNEVGMAIGWSAYSTNNIIPDITSGISDERYSYVALPHFKEGIRVTSSSATGIGISSKSKNAQASWKFLRSILLDNNEMSQQLAGGNWITPKTAYQDVLKTNPNKVNYVNELDYIVPNVNNKIKEWYNIHYQINKSEMTNFINSDESSLQLFLDELALKLDKMLDNLKGE